MTAFPHDSLHPFAALHGVKPVSNDTTISIVELEGDETSDENLMIAHQAGDERAFPMLLERYRSDLHRYLQRFWDQPPRPTMSSKKRFCKYIFRRHHLMSRANFAHGCTPSRPTRLVIGIAITSVAPL